MRTTPRNTRARLVPAGLLTAGAVVAALLVAPQAALAAGTFTPSAGPIGTSVTITSSAAVTGTPGVEFLPTACTSTTYTTPSTTVVAASTVTKSTDNLSLTFTVPTLALGTSGVPKAYYMCVYASTTAGAVLNTDATPSTTFNLVPAATPTAVTGPNNGGNTLTVNVPATAAVLGSGPYGVAFTATGGCLANMPSTTNNPLTSTATKAGTAGTQVTIPVPTGVGGGPTAAPYSICIYSGITTSGTLVAASSSSGYSVTAPSSVLSNPIGAASTGPNPVNLTLSSPSNNFLSGVTTAPAVVFVAASVGLCPGTYGSPGANTFAAARKLANNKAAFQVPTGPSTTTGVSTPYNVCLYASNATDGRLLTATTYTVANVPTITAVLPSMGSALGGNTITVTGSNFPATSALVTTATLGGVNLTNITPASDGRSFTATAPAHALGKVTLVVGSAQGSDILANAYEYVNSIQVSPNTAPNTALSADVDVQGTGFSSDTFSTTPNTSAHVYLVDGVYNGVTGAVGTTKSNGPVAECASVLVISDNELACSMNLTAALDNTGAAVTNGVHTGMANTTTNNLLTFTTSVLSQGDVGKAVGDSGNVKISSGTTIAAVLSPTVAVMSANAAATTSGTAVSVTIGSTSSSITITTGAISTNTIAGAAGIFSQSDVGKYVTGTNTGTDPVVLSVNDTGTTATLSVSNTGAVTAVTLSSGNPVPSGAYNLTVVNNAATNAATATNLTIPYMQTVISSGSTFTVAPF